MHSWRQRIARLSPLAWLVLFAGCGELSIGARNEKPAVVINNGDQRPASIVRPQADVGRNRPEPAPSGRGATEYSDPRTPVAASPGNSVDAAIQVFFSDVWGTPEENRRRPGSIADRLSAYIDATKRTLDICCFEIDNRVIVDAITRAHQRGVKIRIVTESDYMNDHGPVTLGPLGIPILGDERSDLMHNKYVVFDNRWVWTGSFNFTENCAYKNNNNGVFIDDVNVAANFATKFADMFERRRFGGRTVPTDRVLNPLVKLRDGAMVENYFSPHDRVDEKIIDLIKRSRRSIKFMAFSFTHDGIGNAIVERARSGVAVYGVFEARQATGQTEYEHLKSIPNCQIVLDGNRFQMHHKVIIVDDQVVVTGSFNFSSNAARGNNENVVILYSPRVAALFHEEFVRVYNAGVNNLASRKDASPR